MTTPVSSSRPTRENFAERLLKGSAKKSYAPAVDIDWDAPMDPDKFFLPPHTVTLFGTPIWDAMTREQQIELSRQEFVNILSAGIWFENILNQALLRDLMHKDVTASSTHYSLTELGDETRHMVMFGKVIERIGAEPVQPRRYQRMIINALPLLFRGPILWGAALVGEEIFDALQRQILEDPDLQPIVLRLMRIHVTEEARHIQYARDGLRRTRPHMGVVQRFVMSNLHGVGGPFYRYLLTIPVPYRRVGLDPRAARRIARANKHHRSRKEAGFAPLAAFFEDVGLMGPIARRMWRRSGFLPR
ncbi:AurF N-oxygenase family protein [Mycobacterium lehmannii]|uniref:AurF N-oxygenase family protein n=1 Tax=Mycobacterium lehmannii TaxID=2048550 RepID=UPI000B93F0AC|nr:diiron oxygenase [Mycobacterium lehmannii]